MKLSFNRLASFFSSSNKYFKDERLLSKYPPLSSDLELIADDRLESMHKLTGIFSRHKVNMTYIKTHLEDFKPDLKKQYTIFMSIEKIP